MESNEYKSKSKRVMVGAPKALVVRLDKYKHKNELRSRAAAVEKLLDDAGAP